MSVSAQDIAKMEHARKSARKEFYIALLEQFCRKIKTSVQLGKRECILTVPVFLVGFPRYDLSTTVRFMCRQLQRLGYIVNLTFKSSGASSNRFWFCSWTGAGVPPGTEGGVSELFTVTVSLPPGV